MTLLAESRARAKRPPPLVEWHRWFAWYPVPTAIDGKLHYAWLQPVERKWGIGRYTAAQSNGVIGCLGAHGRDRTTTEEA